MYDHGSLGRAAVALDLTQPALSKTIHQLERELNVALFERTPKGLVPTVYAETLSQHARTVQSELRHAEREIALLAGAAKGLVRIGATPSVAGAVLPRAVERIHLERPGIDLTVIEGLLQNHAPALRRGELDLVVGGWASGMGADLVTEVVGADAVGVFVRAEHPLAGRPVELPELLEHVWAMPPATEFWRDHLDRTFVSRGLAPPAPVVTSNSSTFIIGIVRRSDYLTYLPALVLGRALTAGEVVQVDVPELVLPIDVSITYRARTPPSASVGAVMTVIRAVCAEPGLRT